MPVTLIKTRWTSGNLEFLDSSSNIIATWTSATRDLIFPSGSQLDLSAAAGILSLAAGEIEAADLASDAVTTVKILNANVTAAKLASDAVETAKILNANVTAAKLATNAVETAKINAAAVTEPKLQLPTDDALLAYRVARATYDFAVNGGAISAISLTTTLPDNAIVIGGFVDVITTCTSGTDAGTGAISVEGANDIVTAVAISAVGDAWDAGRKAIVPKANTPETTGVKTTAARAITFTIAVEPFTAGAFVVFLLYVVSD